MHTGMHIHTVAIFLYHFLVCVFECLLSVYSVYLMMTTSESDFTHSSSRSLLCAVS